ncbi:conserved hypothetical protein [Streptomyces sp. SPB78]|nr:conserved hypothetical protein [Streptomyces sp. SPB78]
MLEMKLIGRGFSWLYSTIVKPITDRIGKKWKGLYEKYIKPFSDAGKRVLRDLAKAGFEWLAKGALAALRGLLSGARQTKSGISTAFGAIKSVVKTTYEKGVKPALSGMRSAVRLTASAFDTAQKGIDKAWRKVKGATKDPVNFVIKSVYRNGIKSLWDTVAKWVHLPKLPDGPKLLAAGGTVGDGWGPARPMKTNRPTAIVGEGDPRYPEYVIPTDPKYRGRAKALHAAAGTQLLASGGALGSIGGAISGAFGKAVDWGKEKFDFLAHPSKVWKKLAAPILDGVKDGIGSAGAWGKFVAAIPKKMVNGLASKLTDAVGFGGGGGGSLGGTIPTGSRRAIIMEALEAAGAPPPGTLAQWLAGMNTLITRESGWAPGARNNWDTNALLGIPSQGLAQVIPPTFAAYVPSALRSRGILDPVANVAASIRYILSRYGNITKVQQANAHMAPAGYALGGFPPVGENVWVGENGPELVRFLAPAQVHSNRESTAMVRGMQAGGVPNITVESHTYVGNREITDIVDHKIKVYDADMARSLDNGRY